MARTKEERAAYVASLKAAAELITDDAVAAFLAHTGTKYSAVNCRLILAQMPEASVVAGFNQWKAAGRTVRKGQKGIAIFVPTLRKGEEEDAVLKGFRIGYVFDITQTDEIAVEDVA